MTARRVVPVAAAMVIAVLNVITQQYYVERSRAVPNRQTAAFVEVANASASRLMDRLEALRAELQPGSSVVSDTYNDVVGSLESYYARDVPYDTPSADFFRSIANYDPTKTRASTRDRAIADRLLRLRRGARREQSFPIRRSDGTVVSDTFVLDARATNGGRESLWFSGRQISVLNRSAPIDAGASAVTAVPLRQLKNDLVFVPSRYGTAYYNLDANTSLFQLEPDLFFATGTRAAVGRYLLFEVLNPSPAIRLDVTLSRTIIPGSGRDLMVGAVIGKTRVPLRFIGRGSAHAVSERVEPLVLNGHAFVMLDTGIDAREIPRERRGLMSLYGRDVAIDPRRISAFVRDISARDAAVPIDDAPSSVSVFPRDLGDRRLYYSGAYEDGWLSEHSAWYVRGAGELEIRGVVPLIVDRHFTTDATLSVDGRVAEMRRLPIGEFVLRQPVYRPGVHRIELAFTRTQPLPADGRPACALLHELRIGRANGAAADVVDPRIELRSGWGPPERFGGQLFRWVAGAATLTVARDIAAIQVDLAPGPGVDGALRLAVRGADEHQVAAYTIASRSIVLLRVPPSGGAFTLVATNGGRHIVSDPRVLDFRVFGIRAVTRRKP